jgi:hypothetical protein
VFELNEGQHHDHLVCLTAAGSRSSSTPRSRSASVRCRERGFELQEHSLALYAAAPRRTARTAQARCADGPGQPARLSGFHRALVALDEFLVGVDAAQLQDGVAHRGFDQHRQVAAGIHGDHHLAHRHAEDVLVQRLVGQALELALHRFLAHQVDDQLQRASCGARPSRRRWP